MKVIKDARFIKQLYQRYCGVHLVGRIDDYKWMEVLLPRITFMQNDEPLFTLFVDRRGNVVKAKGHAGMTFHKDILFDPQATSPLVKRFLIRHGFLKEGKNAKRA